MLSTLTHSLDRLAILIVLVSSLASCGNSGTRRAKVRWSYDKSCSIEDVDTMYRAGDTIETDISSTPTSYKIVVN